MDPEGPIFAGRFVPPGPNPLADLGRGDQIWGGPNPLGHLSPVRGEYAENHHLRLPERGMSFCGQRFHFRAVITIEIGSLSNDDGNGNENVS